MNSIDQLVYTANFGSSQEKSQAQLEIWNKAQEIGAIPCSIFDLYQARAEEKIPLDFTVPAINLRGLAYHSAQEAFKSAQENRVGALIFEIARSEMGYTDQNPAMYMASILGAAIKNNWQKPIFLQGDHFQTKPQNGQPDAQDLENIKKLIKRALSAGFFNIDLDGSLLIKEGDQEGNAKFTAQMRDYIRQNQPESVNVSLGAEINPIGVSVNTSPDDLDAFMNYYQNFQKNEPDIGKIAIQTGTAHGGIVNPDGSIKKLFVSTQTIKDISNHARDKYKIGGVVQHGASTLSDDMFPQLAQSETLEVHLSTGFQNLILDHSQFPQELRQKMQAWVLDNLQDERRENQTKEQFLYKKRKKAWKEFKKETWNISNESLDPIMQDMKNRFDFYFKSLNVINTRALVDQYITPINCSRKLEDFEAINNYTKDDSPEGLDD